MWHSFTEIMALGQEHFLRLMKPGNLGDKEAPNGPTVSSRGDLVRYSLLGGVLFDKVSSVPP